ncbi:MAG: fibronectin type III domain-containing protein [Syntrophotaleaceae bacterium]
MNKLLKALSMVLFAMIIGLCLAPSKGFAKDITLSWDPSPSSGVVGYKLYYQADSATLPMTGTDAAEGSSPIDVGNATTFTLTGLSEWSIYYFRTTAYDSQGNESEFSNLVASEWIPAPLSPANNSIVSSPARLTWTSPPAELNLTFTVYYGTDPSLRESSTVVAGGPNPGSGLPPQGILMAILICMIGMTLQQLLSSTGRKRLAGLALCSTLAMTMVGCGGGGGGGGDDGAVDTTPTTSVSPTNNTVVVPELTGSSHTTGNLESGRTYYWKVVAVDEYGQEFESQTSSFRVQ